MVLKRQITFFILILLTVLPGADCLAENSINPFQGTWINDYGSVNITYCKEKKCKIEITTANGAHTCDLEGKLITQSSQAIFQIGNSDTDTLNKKQFVPINLSLSKQVITVTVPEESHEAARGHCGLRGFFEGEYTNSNAPRIYKASFNCNKAKTKIEFAICQSSNLAYADIVLSKLYFQLKTKLLNNIVNQQKEWIKDRDTCSNSLDLTQCISDKYSNRILTLQQKSLDIHSVKMNANISYNYDYLLFLSKHPYPNSYEIYEDPPLQNYLNAALPKDTIQRIMPAVFHEIELEYSDDSLIMLKGGAPGLYTICEGALVLTKDHQTWLAYINISNQHKTQIIVLCPKNADFNELPDPLNKWMKRLLPHMDNKEINHKRIFS
jgi:hypothetical protein